MRVSSLLAGSVTALSLLLAGCNFTVSTSGNGRIVSSPEGIDCHHNQGNCVVTDYEKQGDGNDEVVTRLVAHPDPGYRFIRWEGPCLKTHHHQCYVKMQGNPVLTAVFEPIPLAASPAPAKTVRFVALGDTGEGNTAQRLVSEAMEKVCKEAGGCEFAVGLGDNIYDDQPTHTYEAAFEMRFELPYANLEFPFFMSLGNHDNDLAFDGLGSFNHAGDIQVAYTYRTDKPSNKWQMPDRYYHYSAPLKDSQPLADFFVLDSNPLLSVLEIAPDYAVNAYKQKQSEWFASQYASSQAPWKIAYTHHPYVSNGRHGNAGFYDGVPPLETLTNRVSGAVYRKWFEENICGKVDLYLAGHDHDMQFLHASPECGKTLFIVSGAGAKSRSFKDAGRNPVYWQQDNTTGFFLIELQGNAMTVSAYTVDASSGETLRAYRGTFPRQR